MSFLVKNCTSNEQSSAHALHVAIPEKQKKPLTRQDLEAIIDVLPEMRVIEDVMDSFYNKLHEDDKLPQFTRIFSQILSNNTSIFEHLKSIEKAQYIVR